MEITSAAVFEALRNVLHPELGVDIIQLGMVQSLEIDGADVAFTLVFSKGQRTNIAQLKQLCVNALESVFGDSINIRGNIKVVAKKEENQESEIPYGLQAVDNIVAIISGKGGVGKSTVAANLAVALAQQGARVGLVDADIFGPSVPIMFNCMDARPLAEKIEGEELIIPIEKYGVKILSIGFFVDPKDAVVWRGPMAANALKQLLTQTNWGELDYLLIDMPPGTSDIHLQLVQTLAVTGAVVVSTPQDVALADAIKGLNMFRNDKVNVPILGLVENMAWFTPAELPENKYFIFGNGGCKRLAEEEGIRLLGQIPIVQSVCEGGDKGEPAALNADSITGSYFHQLAANVAEAVDFRNQNLQKTERVKVKKNV